MLGSDMSPPRTNSNSTLVQNKKTLHAGNKSIILQNEDTIQQSSSEIIKYPSYERTKLPDFMYFMTFATTSDLAIYFFGIICALIAGVGLIGIDIAFGRWSNAVNTNDDHLINKEAHTVLYISIGIAVGLTTLCTLFLCCMTIASERICSRMRTEYFNRVLHQDISYFYDHGSGEIATRMIKDINVIEAGMGEKAGYVAWAVGTVVSGYVTAFTYNARLSGFLLSTLVAFLLLLTFANVFFGSISKDLFEYEGRANSYIEQIFSNTRIIQSFMAENFVSNGYKMYQQKLEKLGFKKSILGGTDFLAMYFSLCALYPMTLWFGSKAIFNEGRDLDSLFVPLYNCVNAFFAVCTILPHLTGLVESFSVQGYLRKEMERRPLIDPNQDKGISFESSHDWDATIRFQNVNFAYPSSPDAKVLKTLSFTCPAGKTTALVGSSGAGKSTIPALILREYDLLYKDKQEQSSADTDNIEKPCGSIYIDKHQINQYNLSWLRLQFAVVSQDPQLLTGSVWENVAHGLSGTEWEYYPGQEVTDSNRTRHIKRLCREALAKADAIDFVEALPNGIDTVISTGLRLSGGQTQRIAIARALVREPKILVFDEATSALDTATEKRVKANLEKEQSSRQMTVIIIAHRLSTVQNADNIIAMSNGELVEQGTHKELFEKHGFYYNLVLKQNVEETDNIAASDQSKPTCTSSTATTTTTTTPSHHYSTLDTIKERRSSINAAIGTFNPRLPNTHTNAGNNSSNENLHHMPDLTKSTSLTTLEAGEAAKEHVKAPSIRRLLNKYVGPSVPEYSLGTINGIVVGASFIVNAWLIGEAVKIIGDPNPVPSELTPWLWYFFIVFVISIVTSFVSGWMFAWASVRINGRLIYATLNHLLKQEAAFFDFTTSGALSASMNSHSNHVSQAFGLISCQILMHGANLLGSVILVFVLSWKLAVVALCPVLPLIITGYVETFAFERLHKSVQPKIDEMSSFCNEHIDAYRTVALFGRQQQVVYSFNRISRDEKPTYKYLFIGSFAFAFSQGCIAILAGLALYWMSQLLIRDEATISTLFTSYEAVFIAGAAAARTFAFVPDVSRCVSSLKAIGVWLEREPKIQSSSSSKDKEEKEEKVKYKDGTNIILELEDVTFRYPTRPEIRALNHVNLCIKEGQKIAFCGTSGSGKSTAMQLFLRMYEAGRGRVLLDNKDIRSYDLSHLRSNMALVPQSTTLFEGTIRENICFGKENVDDADVWEACSLANITEMINELPEKLDTQIGLKGNTFSGGQKQRISIARAMLRKPRILLLDEATSALDSNSEAAVQEALQVVSKGRTTISIAHRLSTIQDSDIICVFEKGEIVEMGNHLSLMAQKNKYFKLVQAQT